MKKSFFVLLFIALLNFAGCNSQTPTPNNTNPETTNPDETVSVSLPEIEAATEESTDESAPASAALVTFFNLLTTQKYDQALALFSPNQDGWDSMKNTSPEEEQTDKTKVLKNYCSAIGTCLKANVLETKKGTDDEYVLSVQFQNTDGTTFILGPCCGATEKEMPSKDKFEYLVKKINGTFLVLTPPVYRP